MKSYLRAQSVRATPILPMESQTERIIILTNGRAVKVPTGLFINNQFVPSVDSQELIEFAPFIIWLHYSS